MVQPSIAVVVLTWNNFRDTDECLESLSALTYSNRCIIVVDCNSTDGSLERLRQRWEGTASFVTLPQNRGSAGGYNAGIRAALAGGAEYVAVLNNDLTVAPDLLERCLEGFASFPQTGVVGPLVTYYDDRSRLWCAGGIYNRLLGYTRHIGLDAAAPDWMNRRPPMVWDADYVNGCCMLFSRQALEAVGLFDERLFLYLDDLDWCVRAWDMGFACRVVGLPLVAHKVSATNGVRGSSVPSGSMAYYMARNSFRVGKRHVRGWRRSCFLFGQLAVRLPRYVLGMVLARRWSSIPRYWRGTLDGLRIWAGGSTTGDSKR